MSMTKLQQETHFVNAFCSINGQHCVLQGKYDKRGQRLVKQEQNSHESINTSFLLRNLFASSYFYIWSIANSW